MTAIGELTATDIFCGAGGSSLGLDFVPGMKIVQAVNHWDLAVEAHNANFPEADHDCRDICGVDPRRYTSTDILWASPECTHHSYARGQKAPDDEAERSRATMWDIPRFAEVHKYKAIIVENVIEARKWAPFDSWLMTMNALGYEHEVVYFNSQFALPTPQSRDRMYVVFWLKGIRKPELAFRPPCWCLKCEVVVAGVQTWKNPNKTPWGRYGTQYLYHCPVCDSPAAPAVTPAATAIDWTKPIQTIGDRQRPLAEKTMQRIIKGLEKLQEQEPAVVAVGGNLYERTGYARVWSVLEPMKTVTGTSDRGVLVPNNAIRMPAALEQERLALIRVNRAGKRRATDSGEPLPTIAGHGELAMVIPMRKHTDPTHAGGEPMHTVTGGGNHHGLLVYNGNPGFVRDMDDSMGTVTGRDKQSLLMPYYGTGVTHGTGEPMGTITSKDRHALVEINDDYVNNCGFRMLKWDELQRGQHMHIKPDGTPYLLQAESRKLTDQQRTKMVGNAVSAPVATLIGGAVAEAIAS